jgi:type VI secretion system secreted protein VgrG
MALAPANESRLTCRLAGNDVLVSRFSAREKVSALFGIDLELASEEEIAFDDVIGQPASVIVEGLDETRYVNGIVNALYQTGMKGRFFLYKAQVVPQVWLLTLQQDCRIFQNVSVPDIVRQIFQDAGIPGDAFEFRLQGSYAPREYCVQYRQTDFEFISRLLEEEGIFYFYEHGEERSLMVLGDGTVNYQPIAGEAQVIFNPGGEMASEEEAVIEFHLSRRIQTGKFTTRDYNFKKPSLDLTSENASNAHTELEVYDYPGKFADETEGRRRAQVGLEAAVMYKDLGQGKSTCPRFSPGMTFALNGHQIDGFNQEYVIVSVDHSAAQPGVLGERATLDQSAAYVNTFKVIPSSVVLRPGQRTAKPLVKGVQTAIVVGPSGEEIHTDEHGRVKVQFHWDRLGKKDENSSCWIRVSQVWAGAGWGGMFIPRIGQEVIVDFIEGDPDRPIITGRVYHGANTPPYPLPDEKTKSAIKSNSSTGGGGFNELRFEDKAGSEEIFLHGQKDWNIRIQSNKTQNVGNDETLDVGNDRKKTVGNNQDESVGNTKTITVGADHNEDIGANQNVSVGVKRSFSATSEEHNISANRDITVGGAETHTVGGSMTFDAALEQHSISGQRTLNIGVETKTITGMKQLTAAVENHTISGARTITVGTETKTITNQTTFLGMDVTTDSGAKMENFAGVKVSNHFALLMELKQICIGVTNANISYTSFKLDQSGFEVNTSPLHVIG